MNRTVPLALLGAFFVAGCADIGSNNPDKTRDRQRFDFDTTTDLSNMQAGIWYSPQGCQYWIIDDGVEGYLSPRYDPQSGLPVCNRAGPDFPGLATGNFKQGSTAQIGDPI